MAQGGRYPRELRERSVWMVAEAQAESFELSLSQAVLRIGPRVGVVPDTLRGWVNRVRVDAGEVPGRSTDERQRVRELEREVRELKCANEILLAASSFFARELDPRLPW